jgi:hypothetical protein
MRLAIAALLLSTGVLFAQTKTLKVLSAVETDPGRLLPAPAADGSPSQKKELAEVQQLIKARTPVGQRP